MRIEARDATIKTASVEVKALTISGKQVTLAVFRQLQEERLLEPATATLNGVPWGWVNYHPDKCAEYGEHLHVVWQKGRSLFRARVQRSRATTEDVPPPYKATNLAVEAMALIQNLTGEEPRTSGYGPEATVTVAYGDYINAAYLRTFSDFGRMALRYAYQYKQDDKRGDVFSHLRALAGNLPAEIPHERGGNLLDIWANAFVIAAKQVDCHRARIAEIDQAWADQYTALKSMDHLFVAV